MLLLIVSPHYRFLLLASASLTHQPSPHPVSSPALLMPFCSLFARSASPLPQQTSTVYTQTRNSFSSLQRLSHASSNPCSSSALLLFLSVPSNMLHPHISAQHPLQHILQPVISNNNLIPRCHALARFAHRLLQKSAFPRSANFQSLSTTQTAKLAPSRHKLIPVPTPFMTMSSPTTQSKIAKTPSADAIK